MNIISKFEHNSLKVRRLCGAGASTPLGDKQVLGKALYDIVGNKTLPVLQKYRMTSLIP